jgi:Arc/MetJ-type ribon-helix-helix transcriptional regulator
MTKREFKFWKVPVTEHLDRTLVKAVALDAHVSKSEFIRCAVREKLIAIGLKAELETIEKESPEKPSIGGS